MDGQLRRAGGLGGMARVGGLAINDDDIAESHVRRAGQAASFFRNLSVGRSLEEIRCEGFGDEGAVPVSGPSSFEDQGLVQLRGSACEHEVCRFLGA